MRHLILCVALCWLTQLSSEACQRYHSCTGLMDEREINIRSIGQSSDAPNLHPFRGTLNILAPLYREYLKTNRFVPLQTFSYSPFYYYPAGNGSIAKTDNENEKVAVLDVQSEVTDLYIEKLFTNQLTEIDRYQNISLQKYSCLQLAESYVKARAVYIELSRIDWPDRVDPIELNKIIYKGAKTVLLGSESFEKVDSANYQKGGFLVIMRTDGGLKVSDLQRGKAGTENGNKIGLLTLLSKDEKTIADLQRRMARKENSNKIRLRTRLSKNEKTIASFNSQPIYMFPHDNSLSLQYNSEVTRPFPSFDGMASVTLSIVEKTADEKFVQYVGKLFNLDNRVQMRVIATQFTDIQLADTVFDVFYRTRNDFVIWNKKIYRESIEIGENGYPVLTDLNQDELTSKETVKCDHIRNGYRNPKEQN